MNTSRTITQSQKYSSIVKFFFYLGYYWMLSTLMLKKVNTIGPFLLSLYPFCIIFLFIVSILNAFRIQKKSLPAYLVTLSFGFASKMFTDSNFIFLPCILIIGCYNINLESFMRRDIHFKLLLLIIVSVLYFAGVTGVNIHYRNGIIRHSMGFTNPNMFSNYVLSILAEYLFLKRKRIKKTDIILAAIGMFSIYFLAGSRTQLLCLIALTAILLLKNSHFMRQLKDNILIKLLSQNIFTILLALSVFISFAFSWNLPILNNINNYTAGRVKTSASLIANGNLSLIGGMVSETDDGNDDDGMLALDNVYTFMLTTQGLIITIIVCIFMDRFIKFLYLREPIAAIIVIIFAFGGLMEHFCLEVHVNDFLLLSSAMLLEKNDRHVSKSEPLHKRYRKG